MSAGDSGKKVVLEEIAEIPGLKAYPFFKRPCIYFLYHDSRGVIYIGQSKNLGGRLSSHSRKVRFDAVYYLPIMPGHRPFLNDIEDAFVKHFRPTLNRRGRTKPLTRNDKIWLKRYFRRVVNNEHAK